VNVFEMYFTLMGGKKAKKGAKEAAKTQAQQEIELTLAKIEDLKLEERNLRGQTIASAAGSGVKVGSGSPLQVLAEQARNFQRERQTVAKVGATNASVITKRGKLVGQQAAYQSYGAVAKGLGDAFKLFGV
jgi:hypothetical protein